jgi:molecular chaperone DnaK (HSP70)
VSGPDELRRAALESVLNWHYSSADLRNTSTQVALSFHLPPEGLAEKEMREEEVHFKMKRAAHLKSEEPWSGERAERLLTEVQAALADPTLTPEQRQEFEHKGAEAKEMLATMRAEKEGAEGPGEQTPVLVQVKKERVSAEIVQAILSQAGAHVGDPVTRATVKRIREAADAIDDHLRVEFGRDGKGGLVLVVLAP